MWGGVGVSGDTKHYRAVTLQDSRELISMRICCTFHVLLGLYTCKCTCVNVLLKRNYVPVSFYVTISGILIPYPTVALCVSF